MIDIRRQRSLSQNRYSANIFYGSKKLELPWKKSSSVSTILRPLFFFIDCGNLPVVKIMPDRPFEGDAFFTSAINLSARRLARARPEIERRRRSCMIALRSATGVLAFSLLIRSFFLSTIFAKQTCRILLGLFDVLQYIGTET